MLKIYQTNLDTRYLHRSGRNLLKTRYDPLHYLMISFVEKNFMLFIAQLLDMLFEILSFTMFILKQNTIHFPITILSLITYESLLSNSHINPHLSSSLNPRTVLLVDALGEELIPILPNDLLFTDDYFLHQIPALVSCPSLRKICSSSVPIKSSI